jgi:hypothetical protein
MNMKLMRYTVVFLGALVFAAVFAPAWAGEKSEVVTINPVPEFAPDGASVPGIVRGGIISSIASRSVVLGDITYLFSPSILFLSANQSPISRSAFDVGTRVGLRLNSNRQVIAMWVLDENEEP